MPGRYQPQPQHQWWTPVQPHALAGEAAAPSADTAMMHAKIGIAIFFMMVILCLLERALRFGNGAAKAQFRLPQFYPGS